MKAAFYKGTLPGWRGWVSRLVRFADRGCYSHCELIFSDGICASSSWYDGGVRFKRIYFNPEHWDFVDLPASAEQEARARRFFERIQGAPYDLTGSLGVVFRPFRQQNGGWFCSEAVAAALGFYGDAWRVGPNMLASMLEGGRW